MDIMDFLVEQAIVLIPVLNILGVFLKKTKRVPDKYIPLILLTIGIGIAILLMGLSVHSVTQGILATGAAVLGNQVYKQLKKEE